MKYLMQNYGGTVRPDTAHKQGEMRVVAAGGPAKKAHWAYHTNPGNIFQRKKNMETGKKCRLTEKKDRSAEGRIQSICVNVEDVSSAIRKTSTKDTGQVWSHRKLCIVQWDAPSLESIRDILYLRTRIIQNHCRVFNCIWTVI